MPRYDIAMWAKNGESVLPKVLARIDAVIPHENIGQKIFVDDSSLDRTIKIAKDFNWDIYQNRLGWINGGTQEALRHVKTKIFGSVEQDVYLAKNFMDLLEHFSDPKVGVSSGIYYPTTTYGRIYSVHRIEDMRKKGSKFFMGVGSNFYKTDVVRKTGFVTDKVLMYDFAIAIEDLGYKWVTDYNVVSDHLRNSFWEDLSHLERSILFSKSGRPVFESKSFFRHVLSVLKFPYYLKTGNPVIPALEFIMRLKLLQIYIKRRL